jgi:serine/threonine protein kinase/Tol biopolymer transport system component
VELTGRILSHYKIIEKIGEGGMAVVYKARDLQLDRNVALKLLSGETAGDSERRRKLAKEAKAASALDHQNIITIYETGTAADLSFIVMELVEGETLDRILGRGPLPLSEALKYGFQVADALSAAHAAGIVHLDLKPSNVIVRPDGWVKVLDFGLARRRAPLGQESPESQSSSIEEGAFGTPVYMSPEQAEGKSLDARSDIFSFAAMLYEMIAGKRPFQGDTPLTTIAAILHKEPEPFGSIVDPTAHPEIRQVEKVVARGLRKDRQSRWQSVADMKIALEDALEERERAPSSTAARRHYAWLPGLIGIVLVVSGVAFWRSNIEDRAPPSFERLTFRRGSIESAKFAPDGQTVLYSAAWEGNPLEIFATRLGNRESRPLGLPPGKLLSVSPSGDLAILLSPVWRDRTGTLARAPLAGGAPREILEGVSGADWGPQGTLAVSRAAGARNRLEFPMGTVLYESQGLPPVSPVMSRSGKWIAFFDHDEIGNFSVVAAGIRGERRILSNGWRAIAGLGWSPKGDEVWFSAVRSGEQLEAVRGVTLSGVQRVVSPTLGLVTIHDIARDGRVLAASSNSRISMHFVRSVGIGERDLSWFDTSVLYGLSEDGRTLLFAELAYGDDQNPAIYLRPTDGSAAVRLGEGNMPSLSPDGKWVVCVRSDREHSQIMLLPTGPGEIRTLPEVELFYHSVELSPDGQRMLLQAEQKNRPVRTYIQDLAGGNPRAVTPEGTRAARFSPDGRFALVAGGGHLSTLALDSKEQKRIAILNSGESVLRWSRDGRSVFLRHTDSPLSVTIYRLDVATGRRERIGEINSPDRIARIGNVAITPDGKSLAYSFQSDLEDLYLVKGWR